MKTETNSNIDEELSNKLLKKSINISRLYNIVLWNSDKPERYDKIIEKWNKDYTDYLRLQWNSIYPNLIDKFNIENRKDISKLVNNDRFIHPFWLEISGKKVSRNTLYNHDDSNRDDDINEAKKRLDKILLENNVNTTLTTRLENIKNKNPGDNETLKKSHYSFKGIHLDGAYLWHLNFEGVLFKNCKLINTIFRGANFDSSYFDHCDLTNAALSNSTAKDTEYTHTTLNGAAFDYVKFSNDTLFTENEIDEKTNFVSSTFSGCRMDPDFRSKLEVNHRRNWWKKYYKKRNGPISKAINYMIIMPFWFISNYGSSTKRIVLSFMIINIIFFVIYLVLNIINQAFNWSYLLPEAMTNLPGELNPPTLLLKAFIIPFNPSIIGEIISLSSALIPFIQIVINYIILAALITRFANMFHEYGK